MIDLNRKLNHPVNNRAARILEKMGRRADPRMLAVLDLMLTLLENGRHPLIYPHQVELQTEFLTHLLGEEPETAMKALRLVGDEVALTPTQARRLKTPEDLGRVLIWALHERLLEIDPTYPAV